MRKTRVIGITGQAYNGKDSVARRLTTQHTFCRVAFASPIKDMLVSLGIPRECTINPDLKEVEIKHLRATPRQLMQSLGDWGRAIYPDFWVRIAERHVARWRELGYNVVLSDVRYENEADFVRSLGGQIWHVVRPGAPQTTAHSSEDGIAVYVDTDRQILNNGTLEQLHERIDTALAETLNA